MRLRAGRDDSWAQSVIGRISSMYLEVNVTKLFLGQLAILEYDNCCKIKNHAVYVAGNIPTRVLFVGIQPKSEYIIPKPTTNL